MSTTFEAVFENGVLRPLGNLALPEHQHVEITIRALHEECGPADSTGKRIDPLEGLRVDTGISDLAEKFDDYRFGQRTA